MYIKALVSIFPLFFLSGLLCQMSSSDACFYDVDLVLQVSQVKGIDGLNEYFSRNRAIVLRNDYIKVAKYIYIFNLFFL